MVMRKVKNMPNLLLVDDTKNSRISLRAYLAEIGFAVTTAITVEEANRAISNAKTPFEVAVIDISLPFSNATTAGLHTDLSANGIAFGAALKRKHPTMGILFWSAFGGYKREIRQLMAQRSQGIGYTLKESPLSEVRSAISIVMMGRNYFSPMLEEFPHAIAGMHYIENLVPSYLREAVEGAYARLNALTAAQKAVLELMVDGFTQEAIARRLGCKLSTIETHVRGIYTRLMVGQAAATHEVQQQSIVRHAQALYRLDYVNYE